MESQDTFVGLTWTPSFDMPWYTPGGSKAPPPDFYTHFILCFHFLIYAVTFFSIYVNLQNIVRICTNLYLE